MAATICKSTFGSLLQLVVEVAWGAQPTGNSASWTWTDITTDALTVSGINIKRGAADESSAAQPANCTITLRNDSGKYSQSAKGVNYPNVKRNVPFRIRLIYNSVSYLRFWGYVTSWTPEWSHNGKYAVVKVAAHGALKRILSKDDPIGSVLKRGFPKLTSNPPIAYWPCEEEQSKVITTGTWPQIRTNRSFASGLANGASMTITNGIPNFGSYSEFVCSAPLSTTNNSSWHGHVNSYTALSPNKLQIQFLFNRGDSAIDNTTILELHNESNDPVWLFRFFSGGNLRLQVYDYTGTQHGQSALLAGAAGVGTTALYARMTQNGANVDYVFGVYDIHLDSSATLAGTFTNMTLGKTESIHVFPQNENTSMAVGHILLQKDVDTSTTLRSYYQAYHNETATARITRLCTEMGEQVSIGGTSDLTLGGQTIKSFPDLINEAASTELGIIADGASQGLIYYPRQANESIAVTASLDSDAGQLQEYLPIDDDQTNCNDFTAKSSTTGNTVHLTYDVGQLSTADIGTYSKSDDFNTLNDDELPHYATWGLHTGTCFGPSKAVNYRYPAIEVNLSKNPSLAPSILNVDILKRIDITNVALTATQQDNQNISLQVLGYEETITNSQWDFKYNCKPYNPARVARYSATSGDNGEFVARFMSDGSTLSAAASSGATSLSVATASGPLWTTVADDFPFKINVGDIPITVTSISGSSSPQTFTVTGSTVTKALAISSAVTLWDNPVMGL